MTMITPTINLNGTSRESLEQQHRKAVTALREALEALNEAAPHPRDYPIHPTDYRNAMIDHTIRVGLVARVLNQEEALLAHCVDSERFRVVMPCENVETPLGEQLDGGGEVGQFDEADHEDPEVIEDYEHDGITESQEMDSIDNQNGDGT